MTEISMPPNPSLWRRATAAYAKLLEILLAACVGILVIPVTLQIISRYTPFIPSYIWTEEMARFLFIWTIMIGAMVGVREVAAFRGRRLARPVAPKRGRGADSRRGSACWRWRWCSCGPGIEFTRFAWNRTSELADLPLWLIHVAWPVAGVTWIVFAGEQIVDEMRILLGAKQ